MTVTTGRLGTFRGLTKKRAWLIAGNRPTRRKTTLHRQERRKQLSKNVHNNVLLLNKARSNIGYDSASTPRRPVICKRYVRNDLKLSKPLRSARSMIRYEVLHSDSACNNGFATTRNYDIMSRNDVKLLDQIVYWHTSSPRRTRINEKSGTTINYRNTSITQRATTDMTPHPRHGAKTAFYKSPR